MLLSCTVYEWKGNVRNGSNVKKTKAIDCEGPFYLSLGEGAV